MKHLSGRKMPIKFRMIDNILTMRLDGGQLPEHGRKSAQSTDALVNTNRKLTITGPVLLVKMEAALTQATELSETIESLGSGESRYNCCVFRMFSPLYRPFILLNMFIVSPNRTGRRMSMPGMLILDSKNQASLIFKLAE